MTTLPATATAAYWLVREYTTAGTSRRGATGGLAQLRRYGPRPFSVAVSTTKNSQSAPGGGEPLTRRERPAPVTLHHCTPPAGSVSEAMSAARTRTRRVYAGG